MHTFGGFAVRRLVGIAVLTASFTGIVGLSIDNHAVALTPVSTSAASSISKVSMSDLPLPSLGRRMNGLTASDQGRPSTHPLLHVGGARPLDVTEGALNLSSNWSGVVEEGTGATFTGVEGDWVVPTVPTSTSNEASATWIGIDGVSASSLIQTGTSQSTGPLYSGTQYQAWVELLPGAEEVIGNTSGPAPVLPGDAMTASIFQDSPGLWTIDLNDTTQGWTFSQQFSYTTPGSTAEWIEEAPMINGTLATLADYGSTNFTSLEVTGTGLTSVLSYPIYMATSSGAIISYPGTPASDSFPLFYGSPSPQVTSISPNQGSTSGGTTVTIGGNFVTGVSAVDLGGASIPFTADVADGTVSATVPAHAAGVVDITVTTPGGTSAISTSDEFTYVAPSPPPASPPAPPATTSPIVPTATAAATHGYWLVGSDGGIFTFGSARFYGSTGSLTLQRPVVGIVPTVDRGGYWLDASDGGVFAFGDAGFHGSIPGLGLNPAGSGKPNSLDAPIVGMVPSADGGGYFMVGSDGGVFAFGDAQFAGSCPGIGGCAGAAVAVMPDASGNGYWLVTQSGHVYTFGDAQYYGAPGPQGVPVTSAVRTPDGKGYWILFANGGVANYGDAASLGSPVGQFGGLNPAAAIFTTSDGGGYWVASANGTVDNYGDAPSDGSMAGTRLNGSIIAATGW